MDRHDIAYLAGLLDGEGCIRIHKITSKSKANVTPTYTLRVDIVNQNFDVLKEFKDKTAIGRLFRRPGDSCYSWTIQCNQASELLTMLLPFMRIKRQQAIVAIEFQEVQNKSRRGKKDKEAIAIREAFKELISSLKGQDKRAFHEKPGEFRESPAKDNPEPSRVNGLRVTRKVQRLTGEEPTDKPDTSARPERDEIVRATR